MKSLIVVSILFAGVFVASTRIRPRLDGKIVGGEPTTIEEHPHMVSVKAYGSTICGGSIISPKYIATAAHCTRPYSSATYLSIRAGSAYRTYGGVEANITTFYQHPDFSTDTHDYDISILELATELTFSDTINAVKLPLENQVVPIGADATCTGWGAVSEGGAYTSELHVVTVQVVSNDACNNAYGGEISDRMLCAGVPEGGKDACQGDSGGPLLVNGELVGIVSWGTGCARPEYPGVYANVSALRSYITEITNI